MGRKVILSPSAQSDLSDIVSYVAQHNQDAAVRLGDALITRAEVLAGVSRVGPPRAGVITGRSCARPFIVLIALFTGSVWTRR